MSRKSAREPETANPNRLAQAVPRRGNGRDELAELLPITAVVFFK
jgi:hypothetical protein